MESKAKFLGHPIHPMLVVFPLGLLVMSFVFDLIHLFTANPDFSVASYWMIAAGVVSGLVAAVFGAIDFMAIPDGTRAKRIGLWHGGGNVVVTALFAVSWLLRSGSASYVPDTIAVALSALAVVLGGVTGWLGGELVDRLGVGVDRGAHLNSPSSLSNRPAYDDSVEAAPAAPTPHRRAA